MKRIISRPPLTFAAILRIALALAVLTLLAAPAGARRLEYGCVMLEAPLADWNRLLDRVPPGDLAEGEHLGAERWPHITVLYGLHDDRTAEVLALLQAVDRPIRYRLVDLSCFPNKWNEVLKFGVVSPDLDRLNGALRRLPHTDLFDAYRPHMTLAYVKPGRAVRQLRRVQPPADFLGVRLVYQTSDGTRYTVTVPTGADPARPAQGPALSLRLREPATAGSRPAGSRTRPAERRTVAVCDAAGLLRAIGSRRTIELAPGTYLLGGQPLPQGNRHLKRDPDTGGLVIRNVTDLTIRGAGFLTTRILATEPAAHVLGFKSCRGIRVESLEMGHVPKSDAICLGSVLGFDRCDGVALRDLNLFGCGAFGLWLERTFDLTLEDSTIRECSQGIAFLSGSWQVTFRDSLFVDNDGGLNLWDRSSARVERSRFVRNHPSRSPDYGKALFDLKGAGHLLVSRATIADNDAEALAGEGAAQVLLDRNVVDDNRFQRRR